ncbi:MAG: TAT-variant-translocated molybdopterin oxidoreductase, partial [Candidatus Acidiferrales bacterium]
MSTDPNPKLPNSTDPGAMNVPLERAGKKPLWQSLEQLADTPEYRKFLEHEFPNDTAKNPEAAVELNRRDMLKLVATSAAVAGLSACTKLPPEKIVPYVTPPEEIIPGKPLFYATSFTQGGIATGLVVESHMGRPTKIEGNASHPGSLGGTDLFAQASILNLYDPDRTRTLLFDGRISTWGDFADAANDARAAVGGNGAGLHILTGSVTSPSLGAQIKALLAKYPGSKWHQFEPCSRDNEREGTRLAFGKILNPVYRLDQADVVVSLDADFLTSGPGHVPYAQQFSARRALESPQSGMNRLYVVESMPTGTGAVADHRWALRSSEVAAFAQQLAAAVGVATAAGAGSKISSEWTAAVGRDLTSHRGASLVVAGQEQPPAVHALAHAMNAALGNVGKTVTYTEPLEAEPVNELES